MTAACLLLNTYICWTKEWSFWFENSWRFCLALSICNLRSWQFNCQFSRFLLPPCASECFHVAQVWDLWSCSLDSPSPAHPTTGYNTSKFIMLIIHIPIQDQKRISATTIHCSPEWRAWLLCRLVCTLLVACKKDEVAYIHLQSSIPCEKKWYNCALWHEPSLFNLRRQNRFVRVYQSPLAFLSPFVPVFFPGNIHNHHLPTTQHSPPTSIGT